MLRGRTIIAAAALVLAGAPDAARAQESARPLGRDSGSAGVDVERRARLGRRGGGVRVGTWDVRGLTASSGATVSTTPAFEGYVRRGLDLHLAIEHSVGVWRRTQRVTETSTGPLGTTQSMSTLESYIIPQFTSIAFFPLTRPEHRIEPYVKAGAGFALGVDDRNGDGGGLFVGGGGTSLIPGYGVTGGAGVEWRLTGALGLTGAGRYQWIRFFQELSSRRTFEGFGAEAGVTYRFQFR
ncbi:MAG: outer membrane protein [Gemmatimonadaceae bacterium]